jgi:cell division septation protein DedD
MTDIGRRAPRRRVGSYWLAAGPVVAGVVAVVAFVQSSAAAAVAPVGLGTAGSFGVLAGSTVTNTGPSIINGDLGVSPGSAVTGFPPGLVNGTVHTADGVAAGAQADLTTAYNDAAGRKPATHVGGFIGAGQTLGPGVYKAASSLDVGGALTLDAHGDPNAVFIFQAASTLVTDSSTTIVLAGGAQACDIFWQVGSSATLGTGSSFQGSILALTSISVMTGDTITGRALARNGAVTLDDDIITVPTCVTAPPTTAPPTTAPPTTAPPTTAPPTTAPPTTAPPTTAPPTTPPPTTAPPTTAPPTTPPPTTPRPSPTPTPTPTGPGPAPTPTPVTTSISVTG